MDAISEFTKLIDAQFGSVDSEVSNVGLFPTMAGEFDGTDSMPVVMVETYLQR